MVCLKLHGDVSKHSPKMDVYSFGILVLETLIGTRPIENLDGLKDQIQQQFPGHSIISWSPVVPINSPVTDLDPQCMMSLKSWKDSEAFVLYKCFSFVRMHCCTWLVNISSLFSHSYIAFNNLFLYLYVHM